jgi:hypothetical protein
MDAEDLKARVASRRRELFGGPKKRSMLRALRSRPIPKFDREPDLVDEMSFSAGHPASEGSKAAMELVIPKGRRR